MKAMTNLKASKALLRERIQKDIAKLTPENKKIQSALVADKLFNNSIFKDSKRVSIFLSIDSEINTEPIVRKIFEEGKKCYIPRYNKTTMEMVKLHSMEDWETLPLTPWKIKQPLLKDIRESAVESGGLDLIIVPGVAFSKEGHRLGHGGGYYDKFLQALKSDQEKPPFTVAIAFNEQIVKEVPVESTDVTIDLVLYSNP